MTKEITKARIVQEIEDKFKLRELEPETFKFSETVVPTYNIEQHLQRWETDYIEVSVTSAPGPYVFFVVPETERWVLRGYNVVFMAAGAYKVTGVYVWRGTGGKLLYLDMVEGQTVSYAVNLPAPVVLEPTHLLYVYVDDYTSTANLRLYIDYMREEIR